VAREVLEIEAVAVTQLAERLDERFESAVDLILGCQGRLVTCGVGKSGAIARKLTGTFSSTGTPSLYLHPTEALHGDLGAVTDREVLLVLSYSGESDEITAILPALKRIGAPLIAMTGRPDSSLGRAAEIVLDVAVEREACPHNLAPTSSTTAMLALGDALALSIMVARQFTPNDFALYHPAGALGRRLLLHVQDVMRRDDAIAVVNQAASLRDVIFAITRAGAGSACIIDDEGVMVGFIVDGDIRRRLLADERALQEPAYQVMNRHPIVVHGNPLAIEVLRRFQELPVKIGEMPVLDQRGCPIGVIMLKDLLRAGIL
jgi:arabinose-5-phosphate isomerase